MVKNGQEAIKEFIYLLESKLAYYNEDDIFTKRELFFEIKELAEEDFGINFGSEENE